VAVAGNGAVAGTTAAAVLAPDFLATAFLGGFAWVAGDALAALGLEVLIWFAPVLMQV
jgi:hypothetical protein